MIRTERRSDGLRYVADGLRELMAALVDETRTTAGFRDLDGERHLFDFRTTLRDGTRVSGTYVVAELPGFRTLDIRRPPDATREDQKRIADEYHAIPPIIPAHD